MDAIFNFQMVNWENIYQKHKLNMPWKFSDCNTIVSKSNLYLLHRIWCLL